MTSDKADFIQKAIAYADMFSINLSNLQDNYASYDFLEKMVVLPYLDADRGKNYHYFSEENLEDAEVRENIISLYDNEGKLVVLDLFKVVPFIITEDFQKEI